MSDDVKGTETVLDFPPLVRKVMYLVFGVAIPVSVYLAGKGVIDSDTTGLVVSIAAVFGFSTAAGKVTK